MLAYYVIFCLAFAHLNAEWIKKGKHINHGVNGLLHFILWVVTYLVTKDWLQTCTLPFIGRLLFDSFLNFLRNLPLNYVPENPKSIVDRVEKFIFKEDGFAPKVVYAIVIIVLTTVSFAI